MSTNINKWTEQELEYLILNYQTMTQKEIAEKLNRTTTAVNLKASRLGLKKGFEYNRHFFSIIDTEEKAYWLGFIWADGCVSRVPATNSGELRVELQVNDKNHLKKLNKSLNGNLQVKTRIRTNCFDGKYADREYETAFLRISSIDMVNDLINIGCVEHKSYIVGLPKLNDELMWHFIRGFFDGDGCVCYTEHKTNVRCDFTSVSTNLITQLRTWLYDHEINTYISMDQNKYRLCIAGKHSNFKFLAALYDNATIYLDRKYYKQKNIREHLTDKTMNCLAI